MNLALILETVKCYLAIKTHMLIHRKDKIQVKLRKVKNLWIKFCQPKTDIKNLQTGSQTKSNNLPEAIRDQVWLNSFILTAYIPKS